MVSFNQQPLIDELLQLLSHTISLLHTLKDDCKGDLNPYKEEYLRRIDQLLQTDHDLWNSIRQTADEE